MTVSFRLAAEFVFSFIIADFLSGLIHWFEDAYFTREMHPWLVRNITEPNRLHHIYPRKTAHSSAWISFLQIIGPGIVICSPLLLPTLGVQPMYFFVIAFGIMSNFVHKWNHQKPNERPRFVKFFHKAHLIQAPTYHAVHHTGDTDAGYCTLTRYLNPFLDKMNFWRGLEKVIFFVTGIKANDPDEPYKYYKMENGKVLEFKPKAKAWDIWPHKEVYDLPVR